MILRTFLYVIQTQKTIEELLDIVAVVSAERDPELLRLVRPPTGPPGIWVTVPPGDILLQLGPSQGVLLLEPGDNAQGIRVITNSFIPPGVNSARSCSAIFNKVNSRIFHFKFCGFSRQG